MIDRPVIEFEGLTKFYGRNRGIVDLNLEIEPGTIFGFLGPNGAGKTTTIRLLLDFIRPSSGTARIFGLDCRQDSLEIKRRIGYLPAEPVVYAALTARNFLEFSRVLGANPPISQIVVLANRLGLDLDRPLGQLSRGDRQKAAIINALMNRPDLLIMDEPTTGLDPLVQQEFHSLLLEARDDGRTVFFSSHVLSEVDRLCDRVGVIREGRLAAVHAVADLKRGTVRRLEIVFEYPVEAETFASLPGVRSAVSMGNRLQITVAGTLQLVIEAAAQHTITDIHIEEASLEETFFQLYRHSEDRGA